MIEAAICEIEDPHSYNKSIACKSYDFFLRPLNIVLGMRKVVLLQDGNYETRDRPQKIALLVTAIVVTVIFAPVILPVLYLKSKSIEHRTRTMQYHINHWQNAFSKASLPIQDLAFLDGNNFSIKLCNKTTYTFTWYGHLSTISQKKK